MSRDALPSELEDLERRLAERVVPPPSEALRERVLEASRGLLRTPRSSRRFKQMSFWTFAGSVAAGFVFWANLSMSAINNMTFFSDQAGAADEMAELIEGVKAALPELDEQAVFRHAFVLRSARRSKPFLKVRAFMLRKTLKEVERWDTY